MSFIGLYEQNYFSEDIPYFKRFPQRAETIATLKKAAVCDVLVVGGGIHGATFAQLAALSGLRTVLLERSDYASGTSSRSSKMAHGGLRYLEMLDFSQVLEGVRAREDIFVVAPHLSKAYPFLAPIYNSERFRKLKLHLGLKIYDLFLREKSRRHRWIESAELSPELRSIGGQELKGGFQFSDGIMNDTRLVIERVLAARQEGALCLNYASVDSLVQNKSGEVVAGWTDELGGEKYEIKTGIVINCAGPWVPFVGRINPGPLRRNIRYSQGTHLLFNVPWTNPALILPMADRHRYYFVWPHFAGTLVGTTERELEDVLPDPEPTKEEVNEILALLTKDLPHSGLNRASLHYSFAGVRTLYSKGSFAKTGSVSRRHLWSYSSGMLSLVGGKFTTAAFTALEGLKLVFKLSGSTRSAASLFGRKLPGGAYYEEGVKAFRDGARKRGLPENIIERVQSRYGARARYFLEDEQLMEPIEETILRGELHMALEVEQSETLEDIMRRRLELEYFSNHGLNLLDSINAEIKSRRPVYKSEVEVLRYKERLAHIHEIISEIAKP